MRRNLKVYHQPGKHGIPLIRLQGKWVTNQADISPGDCITVQGETGRLVIRKVPKPTVRY